MTVETCETCAFWCRDAVRHRDAHDLGECRASSPVGNERNEFPRIRGETDGLYYRGYWPWTSAAQWCGTYRPRA